MECEDESARKGCANVRKTLHLFAIQLHPALKAELEVVVGVSAEWGAVKSPFSNGLDLIVDCSRRIGVFFSRFYFVVMGNLCGQVCGCAVLEVYREIMVIV